MDQGLVDLSLFDDFPAASHHFTTPQRPAFQRLIDGASQGGGYRGLHLDYPRPCTMKPLPPLPRKIIFAMRLDPRPGHGRSRCILSRIQRIRLDGHESRSTQSANTLQQRRHTHPVPQLILSAPLPAPAAVAQPEEPSRPACPMIWMPDAQMWMIVDDNDLVTYVPPEYYSPPPYEQRQYAHSEPSPSLRPQSEYSPIRTQFRTLIERQDEDERLSPLFQEAIHSVSMHDYDHPNEPPTFQVERDWQSAYSTRESWHTATSGISAASTEVPTDPRLSECERWVMEIERPSSAL